MENVKVCVIGAGASGITAVKTLKEAGINVDCYEKGSKIGGLWRFNNDNGHSAAYKSLHINTNKNVMAYSDFPMPEHYPMFPHHTDVSMYFDAYVAKFDLLKHIQFLTEVKKVVPNGSGFTVYLANGSTKEYSHVVVANGHHWQPKWPNPPFPGSFTGEEMHSHTYRDIKQIENKNVLVVGIGNSAVDIACEAARLHSGKVYISTRSGAYIVPNWIWSKPFDSLANPLTARLPLWLQRKLLQLSLWLARGNQEDYGVPVPKRPLLSEHPTVSQDLLNLCGRGLIQIKPNIQSFQGKTVYFEDGSSISADILIYATGYKVSFPFLDFLAVEENEIKLYKNVIHPDYPNLFFLGLLQPLGAIMPLAEVQAKWVAKILLGQSRYPSSEVMRQGIADYTKKLRKRYKRSERHTLQVDFYSYKAEIEKEMAKI